MSQPSFTQDHSDIPELFFKKEGIDENQKEGVNVESGCSLDNIKEEPVDHVPTLYPVVIKEEYKCDMQFHCKQEIKFEDEFQNNSEGDLNVLICCSPTSNTLYQPLSDNLYTAQSPTSVQSADGSEEIGLAITRKSSTSSSEATLRDEHHSAAKPYQCKVCNKCFRFPSFLKVHSVVHSNCRPIQCPHCGRGYKRKFEFWRHNQRHTRSTKGQRSPQCPVCSMFFYTKKDLKRHQELYCSTPKSRLCPIDLSNKCSVCNSAVTTARLHVTHGSLTDGQQSVCSLCCSICRNSFDSTDLLIEHYTSSCI